MQKYIRKLKVTSKSKKLLNYFQNIPYKGEIFPNTNNLQLFCKKIKA